MIVEYTRYRIPEDRGEAFVNAYQEAVQYLASSPACLAYELTHREFFTLVQPFFHDIEEMQHYELTSVVRRL